MATPHLILLGYGITDSLQLTVESQRALARFGNAYALGVPANLGAYLKAQRVKVTDISSHLSPGRAYADAYLEVATFLLNRTAQERPVLFLSPGNPVIFNSIGRYLVAEGRRLGLSVQVIPAVSQLDLVVAALGLDVAAAGLQVFDAGRLAVSQHGPNAAIPALVMNLAAAGQAAVPSANVPGLDLGPLAARLLAAYPAEHPAILVQADERGTSLAPLPLGRLAAVAPRVTPGMHLFLPIVAAPAT